MKTELRIGLAFISGLLIGAGGAYYYLKDKFEKKSTDEIQKIRDIYQNLDDSDLSKGEVNDKSNDEVKSSTRLEIERKYSCDEIAKSDIISASEGYVEYGNYFKVRTKEDQDDIIANDVREEELAESEHPKDSDEDEDDILDEDGNVVSNEEEATKRSHSGGATKNLIEEINDDNAGNDTRCEAIDVTLWTGGDKLVLTEDLAQEQPLFMDDMSIPEEMCEEMAKTNRWDFIIRNNNIDVIYYVQKRDESYEDIMNNYHGGF